jgi:hypothetical protein
MKVDIINSEEHAAFISSPEIRKTERKTPVGRYRFEG